MKSWKLVFFLTFAVSLTASTVFGAAGAILVDEDFEDGVAFEEQNWPAHLINEARAPQLDDIALYQGYEIRADVIASTKPMTAPVHVPAHYPYITTDRFFTGTRSLCLSSNATSASTVVKSPTLATGNWVPERFAAFQVAVSMNESTSSDPWPAVGTEVARVRYTITAGSDKNFDVKFVVNSSTSLDIISVAPAAPFDETQVGTMRGGAGDWAMVSFIQQSSDRAALETTGALNTQPWVCHDIMELTSGRNVYIGPQPIVPLHFSEPGYGDLGNYAQVVSGVHVYVNSDAPCASYLPNDIDGGNRDFDTDAVTKAFQITANSGAMDIYIDDVYWDVGSHDNPEWGDNGTTLAQAARMQPFTGVIDPTWGAKWAIETPLLSARDWTIYE